MTLYLGAVCVGLSHIMRTNFPFLIPRLISGEFQAYRMHYETYEHVNAISKANALTILQSRWTSTTSAETEAALAALEKAGILRKFANRWKILRPSPPVIPPPPRQLALPKGQSKWKPQGITVKPGECPKCGYKVDNPRRHNNPIHTPEKCREMICKRILEE